MTALAERLRIPPPDPEVEEAARRMTDAALVQRARELHFRLTEQSEGDR